MRSYRVSLVYLAVTMVATVALVTLSCGDDPTPTEVTVPLTVVSTTPTSSQENVSTSVIIRVTFSHDLDSGTVTAASFFVEPGVPGNVNCLEATATFIPAPGSLELNTVYQVNLTTDIMSVDGRRLASNYAWVFRTESDSVEALVRRYEVALNSHDTSRIGALMLDDFLHNGRDKACYLDYLKQSFARYPGAAFTLELHGKTTQLDIADLVVRTTTLDGAMIIPYTDTVAAARVDRRWYLKGDRAHYSPGIKVARFSHNNQYSAVPVVDDNGLRAALITVTGPGKPANEFMAAAGDNCTEGKHWFSSPLDLAGEPPSLLPLTYSFVVTGPYGSCLLECSTSDYFGEYAVPIFPLQSDTVTSSLVFVWHPIPGYQTINYGIRLGNGWEKYTDFEDTMLLYDGPPLMGDSMHYYLIARPRGQLAYSAQSVYFQIR